MTDAYDFGWMCAEDIPQRLFRARTLLRNVVRIAFAGECVLDWSSPRASFQGVMVTTRPKTILINPSPVIRFRGQQPQLLMDALRGVALHEASHAAYTDPAWADTLNQVEQQFQGREGRLPARSLLIPVTNWSEDNFIEDRLGERFPGFIPYFRNARLFFLPDATCRRILTRTRRLHSRFERDSLAMGAKALSDLVCACVNLLSVLVNRPGLLDEKIPPGLSPLLTAAGLIHVAGREPTVYSRLTTALQAADAADRLLRPILDQSPDGAGRSTEDEESQASVAKAKDDAIDNAIEKALRRRVRLHRDGTLPLVAEKIRTGLSRKQLEALIDLEACGERLSAIALLPTPSRDDDSEGAVILEGKTVRFIDSIPDTLFDAESYDLTTIASNILSEHMDLARQLKNVLQVRSRASETTHYGQTTGEIDEDALPLVRTGSRDIYLAREPVIEKGIDLAILVDESGSMAFNDQWELAAAATICLEYALRRFRNERLRVYGFTTDAFTRGETVLYRHYDSGIPRLCRPEALGWGFPKASNSDGIALAAMRRTILADRSSSEACLLMISDGEPSGFEYDGSAARDHVHREVQEIVRSGIRFAHLQIGSAEDAILNRMYGERWSRVTAPEEIPNAIATLALRWLSPG